MSETTSLKLKNPKGWFAAGDEVRKAVTLLTDGAFKVFVYICLHARRDTGRLETGKKELAKNLHKSQNSVRKYLRELEGIGICKVRQAQNGYIRGLIEIEPEYWPYERESGQQPLEGEDAYVVSVKELLLARACVRPFFSIADEKLAREWFEHGVPLEQVEQTILCACGRKYISWRNGQPKAPINSLRYFESTLEEIRAQKIEPEYWGYIRFRMERVEKLWIEGDRHADAPVPEVVPTDVQESSDAESQTP